MGYLQTCSLACQVYDGFLDLPMALYVHLQSNNYPPISPVLIPFAMIAIDLVANDEPDEVIVLPRGEEMTADELVDLLHLEPFVSVAMVIGFDEETDQDLDEALQDEDETPADQTADYSAWLDEVNKIVQRRTGGIYLEDLADWLSRDCYDSGMTPAEGADEALANDDLANIFMED